MGKCVEKSKELFLQGYNCAQAIAGGFAEEVGLNFETAIKLASSLGGGMGGMREVCGAVSGAFVIVGAKCGYVDPTDSIAKANHYKTIQNLAEKFKEKWGTIICRDIMKQLSENKEQLLANKGENYQKRPCLTVVEDMAIILEKFLEE